MKLDQALHHRAQVVDDQHHRPLVHDQAEDLLVLLHQLLDEQLLLHLVEELEHQVVGE